MQWGEPHESDDGCAVWICDNSLWHGTHVEWIDFWNDERHFWIHAEGGRVVDNDGPGSGGSGRELFGGATACAEQCNVDTGKGILRQLLHGDFFSTKGQGLADRARGCEQP